MTAALPPSPWSGPARRLVPGDLEAAAKALGVPEPALVAVLAVEARGQGFDAEGRPVILREGHVYHRQLKAHRPDKLALAVAAGLAWSTWDRTRYQRGGDAQYWWLAAACEIDRECAFRSVSIGIGQILGENYAQVGYGSAEAMFEAFKQSEQDQLAGMLRLIRAWGLVPAMVRGDWATFAKRYNGAGNVPVYSAKLAAAHRQAGGAIRSGAPVPAPPPRPAAPVSAKPSGRVRIYGGTSAEVLNAAELARVQAARVHGVTADDLNARELARIRGDA